MKNGVCILPCVYVYNLLERTAERTGAGFGFQRADPAAGAPAELGWFGRQVCPHVEAGATGACPALGCRQRNAVPVFSMIPSGKPDPIPIRSAEKKKKKIGIPSLGADLFFLIVPNCRGFEFRGPASKSFLNSIKGFNSSPIKHRLNSCRICFCSTYVSRIHYNLNEIKIRD